MFAHNSTPKKVLFGMEQKHISCSSNFNTNYINDQN
uniref:Uncharacterized protein n=1 Tax=Setaria italica TaxID=4555 RepID=K4A413_SETIT